MKRKFSKIPNNFFYNSGVEFQKMGGKYGMLVYLLLTERKNLSNQTVTTLNLLMDELQLEINRGRHRKHISKALQQLCDSGYIELIEGELNGGVNKSITLHWKDLFPNRKAGWVKFYAGDFKMYKVLGGTSYIIMWILRMFTNSTKGVSYISISDIADLLQCGRTKVQNTINLFRESGLFIVKQGEYYYSKQLNKSIRLNNEYRYTANITAIMTMAKQDIDRVLQLK